MADTIGHGLFDIRTIYISHFFVAVSMGEEEFHGVVP
jgi:hypothetical protein